MKRSEKKVLICLPESLGLCLSTLPLLSALLQDKEAPSVWGMCQRDDFAQHESRSDFEGWIELPERQPGLLQAWRTGRLKHGAFDVFVDASSHRRGVWAAWLAGIPMRVGLAGRSKVIDRLYTHLVSPISDAAWEHRLELLKPLELHPGLEVLPFQRQAALPIAIRQYRESAHLTCQYVAIHTGNPRYTGSGWRSEDFGKVAKELGQRYQLPSLFLWHGESGRVRVRRAAAKSGGHGLVSPPLDLGEIAELLRQSAAVISGDQDLLAISAEAGWIKSNPLAPVRQESIESVAIACHQSIVSAPGQPVSKAA